jgi:hypothetical protein
MRVGPGLGVVVAGRTEQELLHYPEVDFLVEGDLVGLQVVDMMDGMVVVVVAAMVVIAVVVGTVVEGQVELILDFLEQIHFTHQQVLQLLRTGT